MNCEKPSYTLSKRNEKKSMRESEILQIAKLFREFQNDSFESSASQVSYSIMLSAI